MASYHILPWLLTIYVATIYSAFCTPPTYHRLLDHICIASKIMKKVPLQYKSSPKYLHHSHHLFHFTLSLSFPDPHQESLSIAGSMPRRGYPPNLPEWLLSFPATSSATPFTCLCKLLHFSKKIRANLPVLSMTTRVGFIKRYVRRFWPLTAVNYTLSVEITVSL